MEVCVWEHELNIKFKHSQRWLFFLLCPHPYRPVYRNWRSSFQIATEWSDYQACGLKLWKGKQQVPEVSPTVVHASLCGLGVSNCTVLSGTMVWVSVHYVCGGCVCIGSPSICLDEGNRQRKGSVLGSPKFGIPGKEVVWSCCYSGGPSIFSGFCFSFLSLFCFSSYRFIFLSLPSLFSCFLTSLILVQREFQVIS